MWFFNLLKIKTYILVAAAAMMAISLSACGFAPVYGGGGPAAQYALSYSAPNNRLERIIYQELALRLGKSTAQSAPIVTVSTSTSDRVVGRSSPANPSTIHEAIVSASVNVVQPALAEDDENEVLYSGSRSAAASYTTNEQLLADSFAREDAEDRAAEQLAGMIRLMLIGGLENKL
jgi:hypothetical protein